MNNSHQVFVLLMGALAGIAAVIILWHLMTNAKETSISVVPTEQQGKFLRETSFKRATRGLLVENTTTLLFLTDPHGFYARSRHPEEKMDADYADFAAFAEIIKLQAEAKRGCDVHFFENGDMVDGGGLTDEPGSRSQAFKLLSKIGFDARTIGNHELYEGSTLEDLKSVLPGRFVTSNVYYASKTGSDLGGGDGRIGEFHRFIPSAHGLKPLLVFGFLYNMKNNDAKESRVETVESVVASSRFLDLVKSADYRGIVVLAHMHYEDPLVYVILGAIRKVKPKTPVVFATGHTHLRRSTRLDSHAFTLEAGKFGDTLGAVSFPSFFAESDEEEGALLPFSHEYIAASRAELKKIAGITELETHTSAELRKGLLALRGSLHLDEAIGSVAKSMSIRVEFERDDSLVRFWVNAIVQSQVLSKEHNSCPGFFIGGSGSVRYDLYKGKVTLDDLWAVAPFKEGFRVVRCVHGTVLMELLQRLKDPQTLRAEIEAGLVRPFHHALPTYVSSDPLHLSHHQGYDVVLGAYDAPAVVRILNERVQTNTQQLTDVPYREGEIDQHSIWVSYFRSQPPPPLEDRQAEIVSAQSIRLIYA